MSYRKTDQSAQAQARRFAVAGQQALVKAMGLLDEPGLSPEAYRARDQISGIIRQIDRVTIEPADRQTGDVVRFADKTIERLKT